MLLHLQKAASYSKFMPVKKKSKSVTQFANLILPVRQFLHKDLFKKVSGSLNNWLVMKLLGLYFTISQSVADNKLDLVFPSYSKAHSFS